LYEPERIVLLETSAEYRKTAIDAESSGLDGSQLQAMATVPVGTDYSILNSQQVRTITQEGDQCH
jgi:hypothetical protein